MLEPLRSDLTRAGDNQGPSLAGVPAIGLGRVRLIAGLGATERVLSEEIFVS